MNNTQKNLRKEKRMVKLEETEIDCNRPYSRYSPSLNAFKD